jgi:hypothetical protein
LNFSQEIRFPGILYRCSSASEPITFISQNFLPISPEATGAIAAKKNKDDRAQQNSTMQSAKKGAIADQTRAAIVGMGRGDRSSVTIKLSFY